MNLELFNYFTTDNISGKKSTSYWLSKNNKELYDDITHWCNKYPHLENIEFKRKIYHYINNDVIIPVCIKCSSDVPYKRLREGYNKYCSPKCQYICDIGKEKWKKTWRENNSNNEHVSKRNETIVNKYGSFENYKKITMNTVIENNLSKYGVEYVVQTEEFKKNRKETLFKKYGSDKYNNPNKTKETRIKNGTQIDDNDVERLDIYKRSAINRTLTIYYNNSENINIENLERGNKSYHIDHKFSLKQGYLHNIPIEIISHPVNLELIYYKDNLVKQDKCSISLIDLFSNKQLIFLMLLYYPKVIQQYIYPVLNLQCL